MTSKNTENAKNTGTGEARRFTLESFDLDGIADALQDQNDFDMVRLVDPNTAELLLWTRDGGLDGENAIDLEDVDAVAIDPIPSYVWYQDMVDFAEGISDETATRRLGRALRGKGAFRHFRDELYEEDPDLVAIWQEFRDERGAGPSAGLLRKRSSAPLKRMRSKQPTRTRTCHDPAVETDPHPAVEPRRSVRKWSNESKKRFAVSAEKIPLARTCSS